MQTILIVAAGLLLNVGIAYAASYDMHSCTGCKNTGSTDFGMMRVAKGRKTVRNLRGLYYTHAGCVKN